MKKNDIKTCIAIIYTFFSICCFSQTDSLKVKKENRFKVAGSVLADGFLSVPRDFSEMGHIVSNNWKKTALYSAGIIGLIAVDKQTTGFLQDKIEPNIAYSLPNNTSENNKTVIAGNDLYMIYPLIGLYAGSFAINNKKGQVAAINAMKAVTYSYVISHILLKTISARNRPQRSINDDNTVIAPLTKNPWDFGDFHPIYFKSEVQGTSFPSFHATFYYSVAKVFQMEYNNYWIPYTFATLVFFADVKTHNHWVSDLLVGGLVGTIIGRSIVISSRKQIAKSGSNALSYNSKKFKMNKQLIPQVTSTMVGLHFIGDF